MKTRVPKFSRPTGLDAKTWRYVERIFKASQRAQRETGRKASIDPCGRRALWRWQSLSSWRSGRDRGVLTDSVT
jgi:hypothetical protein